jgi:transcriptional regulator with XRE-family HTH domain
MMRIKLLAETDKTVTLRRADFQALLQAAEDNVDLAAVETHSAEEKRVGWDAAKRNYLTRDETERLLDGESPIRVWREKRGMTQRALAEAAQVSVSYLAEIEGGKKPGSRDALQRLVQILEVPMESLAAKSDLPWLPVTRSEKAAERLGKLAEQGGDRDRLADEARAIVSEWLEIAEKDGVRHQVRAAIGTLESITTAISTDWARRSIEQDRIHDTGASRRMKRISDALEAAIDALATEYRKI